MKKLIPVILAAKATVLAVWLALTSLVWSHPETVYLVRDGVLDGALARAEAKALAEYQAMEEARVRAGAKASVEYKAMEEARTKASAKTAPRLPH